MLETQVDAVAALTGEAILTVTADAGYDYGKKIYGRLERRDIKALIRRQGGADPKPDAASPLPPRCPQ